MGSTRSHVPAWMQSAQDHEIFPEFFYSIGRTKTDMHWLKKQLYRLSRENRIEACLRYSNTYLRLGRNQANSELSQFVLKHGLTVIEAKSVQNELKGNQKAILERLDQLRNSKPVARSKYGEIFRQNRG